MIYPLFIIWLESQNLTILYSIKCAPKRTHFYVMQHNTMFLFRQTEFLYYFHHGNIMFISTRFSYHLHSLWIVCFISAISFFLCSKSVVGGSTKSELVNVRVCNLMTLNTANIVNCSSLSSEYAARSNEESCKILIKSEANCSCGIERHFFKQND